ncbi:hypothetical protein ACHAPJ_006943 [Fusarium lateritium]
MVLGSAEPITFHQETSNHLQHTSQRSQTDRPEEQPQVAQNTITRNRRRRSLDIFDQQKGHRPAPAKRRKTIRRSVHFDEVFQNGNAPTKHVIVQWPLEQGSWYILRCEEHNFNFKDNPLLGAAAHIRSKKHGKKSSDYNSVVDLMGVEVLGCDEISVEKNNIAAREAFKRGYEHASTQSGQVPGDIAPAQGKGGTRDQRGQYGTSQAVADLEGGQIYRVYWKLSKQWLAALLLPMHDLQDVGVLESIESLGLLKDLPQCYAYDHRSKVFSWKDGYEDNGPRVSARKFPVMFFDGSPFPSKSSVAWVSADNLEIYDASAQGLIEHSQQVLQYLESRQKADEARTSRSSIDSDSECP